MAARWELKWEVGFEKDLGLAQGSEKAFDRKRNYSFLNTHTRRRQDMLGKMPTWSYV